MQETQREAVINHKKLQTIAWLESLRWDDKKRAINNFETSFYCDDSIFDLKVNNNGEISNLTTEKAEAILLTHYLVYICDRQMDYRDIFKRGGYTISCLVKDFLYKKENIINSKDIRKELRNLIDEHISPIEKKKDNEDESAETNFSYYLIADLPKNINEKNENIISYFSSKDAKFSSRFMVVDIVCIYRTLVYLCEKFNGSFSEFLKYAVGLFPDKPTVYLKGDKAGKPLYSLAYAFYRLTYQLIPQVKGNNDNIKSLLSREEIGIIGNSSTKKDYLYSHTHKPDSPEEEDTIWTINGQIINKRYSFENKKYSSKRLWCVARDFIYHSIFKECFKEIVGNEYFEHCQNDVESLELPGDVWNNNPTFAKCFWYGDKNIGNIPSDLTKSSKFVRRTYEDSDEWKKCNEASTDSGLKCYPKDFDITFSFVPNMCSSDKCDNCPLKSGANFSSLDKFCHGQNNKLCSFVLYTTGIEHKCSGISDCKLRKILETK